MSVIVWDATAARTYENGISKVVIYPIGGTGVPWSGVVSITDTTPSPNVTDCIVDGVKVLDFVEASFFQAKLEAISMPDFAKSVIGDAEVARGYRLGNQVRPPFNLCYRTEQSDGYKLHLIYNATATPTKREFQTLNSSPSAPTVEMTIGAVPTDIPNLKNTAHVVVDSTHIGSTALTNLENILYGTISTDPRFPAFTEYGV